MTDPENADAPGGETRGDRMSDASDSERTSGKRDRRPWETEPYVDAEAATQRAMVAAQPPAVDLNTPAMAAWLKKAWDDEIGAVTNATEGHRQDVLFPAACNLFEIVAAGALDETAVYEALRDACRVNGLEQHDGAESIERTLRNARRKGFDKPRDLSVVGTRARARDVYADDTPKLLMFDDFRRLERGFWTERETLKTVYLAALSRMCAPWAVLAHCAAIALVQVRPHIVLPALIGHGSLNWFAAVAAKSGDSKSASEDVARDLMPCDVDPKNLGSGEGLVDAFVRPADKETGEPAGLRESVLFTADEIDSLRALGSRTGATLSATLRSAFSGKTLGFSYRGNARHLAARSYRLALVVNVQPARAGALLDDQAGGLLQRFMWFPATDTRIDTQTPAWPGQLTLPPSSAWLYPRELVVPYETIELIKDEAVRRNRGESDPLDGHELFMREKFAFALAVLDGRDAMTSDDWRLAGVAMRVSKHVRAFVTQEAAQAAVADAERRGADRGIEHDAANTERSSREHKRRRRIETLLVGKLTAAGADGLTEGDLKQSVASRDRWSVQSIVEKLERDGEVKRLDKRSGERTVRWALVG